MKEMHFYSKSELHDWFIINHHHDPIWIIFDKRNVTGKLTQEEALDEALCFGWIDGLMKRIDDIYFKKYFCMRRAKSVWSTKNKNSVERLIKQGKMTEHGYSIIEIAKKNGSYDRGDQPPNDYSLEAFEKLINNHLSALSFYKRLSKTHKMKYAMHYFTAKKDLTRMKRLSDIIYRLENKLKP